MMYGIQLGRERAFLLGWAAGFLVYFFIIGAAYATIKDREGLDALWQQMPQELRDTFGGAQRLTTPGGYLESQGTTLLPLVLGGILVSQATRRLSGAEQAGELDLLLSLPMRRATYFWSHWGVGVTQAIVWTVAAMVGAVVGMALAGVTPDALARIAFMVVEVLPFVLAVHAGALLAGAALHRRPPGLALLAALLATSFLMHVVGSLSDTMAWLRWLSLYSLWVDGDPFEYRSNPWYLAIAGGIVAVCLPLASRLWVRKDLTG